MIRHLITALFFILFLFFGYQAGMALGNVFEARSDRSEIAFSPYSALVNGEGSTSNGSPDATLPNGQRSILLIGVDDLESRSPRLESIWLLSYVASATRLTFLPAYPTRRDTASNIDLPGLFRLSDEEGQFSLDPAFLDAMREQIPWWSSYIVFDGISWLEVIGSTSGLMGNEEIEQKKLEIPPHAWEDPQAAQAGQAILYQEFCWQASANGSGLKIEETIQQYPNRFLSDLEPDQLLSELVQLRDHIRAYSCEFPTLNPR